MPRVVGIDCGGTTVRAVALEDGREIWSGEAGSAQIAWGHLDQLRTSLSDALEGCPEADAVCGAFAGMVSEGHRDQALQLLAERFQGEDVFVVPDYEAALEASDGADVCLIAGTGSVVCSRRPDGSIAKSGGRGYVLGDEGSAFQYGREALLHYLDDPEDDISSRLREAVEEAFGTLKRTEIIANLYGSGDIARRVASLLPAFSGDASEGALYALKALKVHAGKLAHLLAVHIREQLPVEVRRIRVACHGGVWKHSVLCHAFADQVRFWVDADDVILDFEPPAPVLGAARLAGRLIEK
ncbi:MAG: N-acetylglucosamine kinase [Fimbriimonadales bacterium]|nr:MAG: N-acetylglucosamine kinase [Fimbriimonadales bacterium]